MKCEEVREQLPDYLAGEDAGAGEAAGPGRAEVEAHLAVCASCQADAAMWMRMAALPDEQPSPALRERFEAMLGAYREGLDHGGRTAKRKFSFTGWLESWWPYQPAVQFLMLLVCLALGLLGGYELRGRGGNTEELAQLRAEVHRTRQLVAVSLLQQQSASERLRGVTWSSRVERPDLEVLSALVQTVRYDTSVDVRLSAIDALRRYTSEPVVRQGIIEALQAEQSPLVHIALIDLVVETRLREAGDALRLLKENKALPEVVRQRAEWGLQQL